MTTLSRVKNTILVAIVWLGLGLAQADVSADAGPAPADSDHDGVPDQQDQCPNTAQRHKLPLHFKYRLAVSPDRYSNEPQAWPVDHKGCEPDRDADGVLDSEDYCPEDSAEAISKGVATNGCPVHSDQDGTPDFRDQCPDTPRNVPTDASGCPV
jgi:OOP family OmpA-OmpF porin